ncbi:membrane protein [Beggiatoa sp. PS]|nr:membrane protein [Beggiatoa sp. PS]
MKDYNFIVCIVLFPIALSLIKAHNWFMRDADSIVPSETLHLMALSLKQKAIIYLVLISSAMLSMLSMLFFTGFSVFFVHQLEAMIAISVLLIASFFLLSELHLLFNSMKKTKQLSCDLFFQPDFFATTSLMLFIELSFLYWLKEAITYFEPYFLVF